MEPFQNTEPKKPDQKAKAMVGRKPEFEGMKTSMVMVAVKHGQLSEDDAQPVLLKEGER
jgi:hypothetical protein